MRGELTGAGDDTAGGVVLLCLLGAALGVAFIVARIDAEQRRCARLFASGVETPACVGRVVRWRRGEGLADD
jgi:hypothetical protein